jgi:DNA-binding CsgD family transcriptional regulator/PAS domain-containing protein
MAMTSEAAFLDLLYDAPAQPSLWVKVMEQLSDMMHGGAGIWLSSLSVIDGKGQGLLARTDESAFERYFSYYAARNPLHNVPDPTAYMRNWKPMILTDEDWMPKEDLVRTEYYNDFLTPLNAQSTAMIRLAARGENISVLNIARAGSRGQFEQADLELARHFHAHLIRAFHLTERLAGTRILGAGTGVVFENSPHALFLLTPHGRVLRINRAADRMVRRGLGLRISTGRLRTERPEQSSRLAALIAGAGDAVARAGGFMALPVAERSLPLSITVVPIGEGAPGVFEHERRVLVCVTDLEAQQASPEQKLRDLFGLTAAEVRLATSLFEGLSLREAAAASQIAVNTATVHLSRIFAKTGVNRQSALLQLMMRTIGPGDVLSESRQVSESVGGRR